MKRASLENVQARLGDYVETSVRQPVLILRDGEPVAMLVGLERRPSEPLSGCATSSSAPGKTLKSTGAFLMNNSEAIRQGPRTNRLLPYPRIINRQPVPTAEQMSTKKRRQGS